MSGFRIGFVGEEKACSVYKLVRNESILDDIADVGVFDLREVDALQLKDMDGSLSSPIFDTCSCFGEEAKTLFLCGDLVEDISSASFLAGDIP
jgi:hypothetical protein